MKTLKSLRIGVPIFICMVLASLWARETGKNQSYLPNTTPAVSAGQVPHTLSNINQFSSWIQWNLQSGRNPITGSSGGLYPRGLVGTIFADGFVWGGFTTEPGAFRPLRVGGSTYISGAVPGYINANGNPVDPSQDQRIRIYRIRKDHLTVSDAELARDAAEFFNIPFSQVTQGKVDSIRSQYALDWNEWPVDLGAPFHDLNGNGIYEPSLGETPGVADADQVIWFVANDFDSTVTKAFYGALPLELELQVTLWAYDTGGPFSQTIFRRLRMINKSPYAIDSMYVCQWNDVDLGNFGDDLVGCDSLLEVGFVYNGNPNDDQFSQHGLPPASVGYALLQGPVVPSPGDTAIFNFHKIPGHKNLTMTSFSYYDVGNLNIGPPLPGIYEGTLGWYNWLRGFVPNTNVNSPDPYHHRSGPLLWRPTRFPLNGDPVAGTGDLDGTGNNSPPGDRRMLISTGPFDIQPGDTQEVVIAGVGGLGSDYLNSVTEMKNNVKIIKDLYGVEIDVPDITSQISQPTGSTTEIQVQLDLTDFANVSAAQLDFSPEFGNEPGFNLTLFDDGAHNDSLANDQIWGNQTTISNRKHPFRADLEIQRPGGPTTFSDMLQNVKLRPSPRLFNWEIVSENGQQDSSINHNERVWLEFKVQNTDLINGLDSLQISQASFSSPIPPGDTISDPSFVLALTATSQGDSATLPYRLGYDHHLDIQSARFPVTAWNPDPIWGDTLDVFSIVGETTNLFPIVADPPLLTGHEYLINFFENSQTGELLWRLIDQTTGAVKLDSAGVSNDPLFPHPVMDGIQWQAHEIIPDFKNFQCIANAAGPLDPPESAAAKFAGFPVSANPGDRQQVGDGRWLIHTADTGSQANYVAFRIRTTRDGIHWPEIIPFDFELRYTARGSWTWDRFNTDTYFPVPFELWNIGIGTPDDTTDDFRMVPILLDDDGDGTFNMPAPGTRRFGADEHSVSGGPDDPYTDWLYWYNPAGSSHGHPSGEAEYLAAEAEMMAGTYYAQDAVEVMARTVQVNWNGGTMPPWNQDLPEQGTVFRIITAKPNFPGDTLLVQGSVGIVDNQNVPSNFYLYQNYPNPFNPVTHIRFTLARNVKVKLEIFNVLGQKVVTLLDEKLPAGEYNISWKGENEHNVRVASGIYFYRLIADSFIKARKMVLLR